MSKDSSPEQNILSEIERIRKLFYSECKDYRLFINFSWTEDAVRIICLVWCIREVLALDGNAVVIVI